MMNYSVTDNLCLNTNSLSTANTANISMGNISCYGYWRDYYYPQVIKESYPVYLQERSVDKGKQAFEILKVLKDKKLITVSKVSDFIDIMDELIKIL